MHPYCYTAHLYHEQLFTADNICNRHYRTVILATSEQTGIPVDKILSDDRQAEVMYARHLVHYFLYANYGFPVSAIKMFTGAQRSSIRNSINNITNWISAYTHVCRDAMIITNALNG